MSHQAKSPENYRFILQQDSPEPVLRPVVETITPDDLLDHSIRQIESLPIDVYASDVNHAGGAYWNSKVMEVNLKAKTSYRGQEWGRLVERLETLFAMGTDPLQIYCEGAHAAGKDFMARIRMNDLHDVVGQWVKTETPNHHPNDTIGEYCYNTGQWKYDHPELLIGDITDDTKPGTYHYWQRQAMNYAMGQVRDRVYGMAEELVNLCDLDVLELDFIRFTFYFHRVEAYAQRHVMTALIRRIRKLCNEAGQRRGRPIRLSARVPDTIELGLRSGIDTGRWLSEGLLDLVSIGGGYAPFSTPWEDIVSYAKAAGIPAMACWNHQKIPDNPAARRAFADRAYKAGITGFKLWNCWYRMPYYRPEGESPWSMDFVNDIVAPQDLTDHALTYVVDKAMDPDELVGSAHAHHAWAGQIPMTIGMATDGIGQSVQFDIPNDMAGRDASAEAKLVFDLFNYYEPSEQIELTWNGEPLTEVKFEYRPHDGHDWFRAHCTLPCGRIKAGENLLEIRLLNRTAKVDPFIHLVMADVRIPDKNGQF